MKGLQKNYRTSVTTSLLVIGVCIISGCSKTLRVMYEPGVAISVPKMERPHKIIVVKFEDIRPRVKPKKEHTYKEFEKSNIWSIRFDQEISTIVLDALAEELTKANFVVIKKEKLLTEPVAEANKLEENGLAEFIVNGKILDFDLEYVEGTTFIPYRIVTLAVSLFDAKTGNVIMSDTFTSEILEEDEKKISSLIPELKEAMSDPWGYRQAKRLVNINLARVIEQIVIAIQENIGK